MSRRWLIPWWSLCGALLTAPSLHAEEQARLVYVREAGTEDCPSEVDLRLRVLARLGYDPFSPQASQVVLTRIEASQQELHGSVELIDQAGISSGKRSLSAPAGGCDQLARGLALSISLTLDPERSPASEPRARPAPEAKVHTAPSSPMSPPTPDRSRPTPTRRPRDPWFAGAALTSTFGSLPAAALGGTGALGFRHPSWSVALEGRALQSFNHALSPRGQLSGRLLGAGGSGCALWSDWGACVLGLVAQQTLQSREVLQPRTSSGLLVAVGLRVQRRMPLPGDRLALSLALEGLANLSRNSARFSESEVWRAPVLSGHALIGVEASIF